VHGVVIASPDQYASFAILASFRSRFIDTR